MSDSTFSEIQLLTRLSPTTDTEGQTLYTFEAITPILSAEDGQTLTGTGVLEAYIYDRDLGFWARMPGSDIVIPSSIDGFQHFAYPAIPIIGPRGGRLLYAASNIGVSGGTTVTVTQLGYTRNKNAHYTGTNNAN